MGMVPRRAALLLPLALLASRKVAAADQAAGITEALIVGARRVIAELGRPGGFLDDPKIRIPLPGVLEKARPALSMVGLSGMLDDLDVRLNHAAEQATPAATDLLVQAIHGLTFKDALGILNGPKDSATLFLERQTSAPLAEKMRPIVANALAEAGAVKTLDGIQSRLQGVPFVPDLKADLTGHTVTYAEKAIFAYLGQEEAKIRTDPAARTTALLKQVFGG